MNALTYTDRRLIISWDCTLLARTNRIDRNCTIFLLENRVLKRQLFRTTWQNVKWLRRRRWCDLLPLNWREVDIQIRGETLNERGGVGVNMWVRPLDCGFLIDFFLYWSYIIQNLDSRILTETCEKGPISRDWEGTGSAPGRQPVQPIFSWAFDATETLLRMGEFNIC